MQVRKVVTVTVPEDVLVDSGYSIAQVVYAGRYQLEVPADYETDRISAEDIWLDGAIRVIERW